MELDRFLLLFALGVIIGAYGTLIGSGGGFILVPLLLFLYPEESTGTITSISLAVVFVSALSGSVAYARQGRINYRAAVIFGAAAIPGSIFGALVARTIPRAVFDPLFGLLLIGLAIYLIRGKAARSPQDNAKSFKSDTKSFKLGAALSVVVGLLSSVFGIGGGVMHVPMLVRLLKFPFAMAAATSQLILATMSLAGTIVHIVTGEFQTGWRRTGALSLGVLVGAQIGVRLSTRIGSSTLVRLLSGALVIVGARLVLRSVG